MGALDIDSRKIDTVRRIDQEVPQTVDNVSVERIREVSRQMPKQAIRACSVESRRVFKE